jgi:RHS repeat-associated protein
VIEMTQANGFRIGRVRLDSGRTFGIMLITCGALLSVPAAAQVNRKIETITYYDDLSLWIVGQTATVACVESVPASAACNGDVATRTEYGWKALPWKTYSFGKLQQTLAYDQTSSVASGQLGTLKTVTDGRGNVTTLSQWRRGVPGTITHPATTDQPTAVSQSASINDDGTIAQITDENGFVTKYDYDAMGRLSLIDYPDGDTVNWSNTVQSFTPATTARFGLPIGHWVQVVATGGGRKVVDYDAQWRPVVESTYISGDAASYSIVVKRYDTAGRLAFQSYPLASLTNYADATLKGTHYTYDALDRVYTVTQDSELGPLTTTTQYIADPGGSYKRIKNPRDYYTRIAYQAFDQPSEDAPVSINNLNGYAYTEIARDPFGKPISIKRRNTDGTVAVTRSYAYNTNQELCRVIEPETGATIMGYDAAGNLQWSAAGLPTTLACDPEGDHSAIAPRRVDRTYDARNRLKTLSFPDGRGNQAWSWTPDGLPAQVVADNGAAAQPATTTYAYNRRRLLEAETLAYGSVLTWPVDYVYNTNGHLYAQVWHGLTVAYSPDSLGRPTQAGGFATGVTYHPNGAIKQFTYGNGITHTLTQNVRGLPDTSQDAYGTTAFLSDGYDYDQNGNVAAITDGATGRNQRGNRTLVYDGLDRLTSATSPMFGTATYAYDVLDNLTRTKVTGGNAARDHYYCYNANQQLAFVRTGATCTGSTPSPSVLALEYDLQGNLSERDNVSYGFDFGNRLRTAPANSRYAYDGLGRRVWDATTDDKYSHYLQNGQLSMTADERRQKVAEYVYLQGSLIAIRERDVPTDAYTIKYQHTDALGSPVVVTDANRTVLERSEYEPYGKVTSPASPQDGPGYTGHVYDAATGLVQMQQRYFDPILGRFLSVDPITAHASPGANFNRYWYANNNPYRFTDPDGRRACGKNTTCQLSQGAQGGTIQVGPPTMRSGDNAPRTAGSAASGNRQSEHSSEKIKTKRDSEQSDLTGTAGVTPGVNVFLLLGGISANAGGVAGTDGRACFVMTLCGQFGFGLYGGAEASVPLGLSREGTDAVGGWDVGLAGGVGHGAAVTGDANISISGRSGSVDVVGVGAGVGMYGAVQACHTWASCKSITEAENNGD